MKIEFKFSDSSLKSLQIGVWKNYALTVFLSILLFQSNGWTQNTPAQNEMEALQVQWLENINKHELPSFLYAEYSGVFVNDSLLIGRDAIRNGLIKKVKNTGKLVEYDTIATYQLYEGQALVLGIYTSHKGETIPSIIGWRKGTSWIKAFEVFEVKSSETNLDKAAIDVMRSSWELYSNQHRPDLIVDNVFSEMGRYFYKGVEYRAEKIADAYGYMRNQSYTIDLTPLKVYQVNENLVYEIGTYKTNGEGLYVLLWIKEGENWKLLLDFNF